LADENLSLIEMGRRMKHRVIHVVRSLRPETGGLAAAVRQLAVTQRGRGDQVTVASLDPADAAEAGVVIVGSRSHGYGYASEYVPWLRANAGECDVVCVHGLWQYQGFGAWRALRGTGTPYVVYCHGMLDVWFKRAHPLKHAKKWLYWPWAEYRVLRDAAAVCFTAEEERRRARESFWLYRANERISPLGIEAPPGDVDRHMTAFFAAAPALQEKKFLLFLGRVHPKKGVDLLLEGYAAAWRGRMDAPALALAGPIGDEAYAQRLCADAGRLGVAEQVTWLPMLSGDVKWGALRACEAFALFSHQENFGVAVVEALACGKPVLISDQIAIHGEISRDGAGFVGPDTVAGASAALRRWRDGDAAARVAMGAAATACFRGRFEIGRATESLASVIEEARARP